MEVSGEVMWTAIKVEHQDVISRKAVTAILRAVAAGFAPLPTRVSSVSACVLIPGVRGRLVGLVRRRRRCSGVLCLCGCRLLIVR
jgi:hypothetical protein